MSGPWTVTVPVPGYGTIDVYRSPADYALVIDVNTPDVEVAKANAMPDGTPRIRISVNDGAVWENPPYPAGVEELDGIQVLDGAPAGDIAEGDVVTVADQEPLWVAWRGQHGDRVLIRTSDGEELSFDQRHPLRIERWGVKG